VHCEKLSQGIWPPVLPEFVGNPRDNVADTMVYRTAQAMEASHPPTLLGADYHWLSDVIAGAYLGTAVGFGVAGLIERQG
jgi:hypothetical protein